MRSPSTLLVLIAVLAGPASGGAEAILVDVTASSGVDFEHSNGGTGRKDYRETMGSGVCIFDHDGDGRQDIYLVTCVGKNRLFRNLGELRFEDVTDESGTGSPGYDMAAVAADIDNDGDADLLVTGLWRNRLYLNDGTGRFSERAGDLGVAGTSWGAGAAFLDADRDGRLDLYVASYVEVADPDTNACRDRDGTYLVCKPTDYPPAPDRFWRGLADGTFEDATAAAGFGGVSGRGLGVAAVDLDGDGDTDLYVANDLDPNYHFENQGDGTFEEIGFLSGTSRSETGRADAGMGVAAGDYDGDGRMDLFVTNFEGQWNTLYHNDEDGVFQDATAGTGLGRSSLPYVGWGTSFLDYDGDGWLDLFVVNGHVEPDAARIGSPAGWKQPDFLYRNLGDGRFADVTASAAPDFASPFAGRGAAVGDLDDDGDPDLVVVNQNGRARVFENRSAPAPWIGIQLRGTASTRDAIGARVTVHAGERSWIRERQAGSSFFSDCDPRLLFRIGAASSVDSVTVRWPSGRRTTLDRPAMDRYHEVVEPR